MKNIIAIITTLILAAFVTANIAYAEPVSEPAPVPEATQPL